MVRALLACRDDPALAFAYWLCVNRWETARGAHHHRGGAALLIALAVVFFFLDTAIPTDNFTLFYGVALVMLGFRFGDGRRFDAECAWLKMWLRVRFHQAISVVAMDQPASGSITHMHPDD